MATGLILYEDDDLLVVNKPAGINSHKPDAFAPDGIHEWLSRRHGTLSVLHRLDKETSGVMVFGKSTRANQSLSRQFETHKVRKEYLLLSDRKPRRVKFFVKSHRLKTGGEETEFEYLAEAGDFWLVAARPLTGKTHQIRRHASESGFPIAGDVKYGGVPAARLMLHARSISFQHPSTEERVTFSASVPEAFEMPNELTVAREMRALLFGEETTAYRLLSNADVVVDWFDGRTLVQWQTEKVDESLYAWLPGAAVYAQVCTKQKRTKPVSVRGTAEERFAVRENGLKFWISFNEGLSAGIFLDQRENRRRLLTMPLAGRTLLNCFAYTCAFSVAAAKAGATTTSVDLSKNYLEWGRENFRANDLDDAGHDFIFGDVFEWLNRFEKKGRSWDVVLLDPPTFSTTKKGRAFQAERDYRQLAGQAARLVARGGWLFCSTNQRTFEAAAFVETIGAAVRDAGRVIVETEFATLPFDFRVAEGEKPYLKTLWARLD
jgi:23S rRNA (cytosine1962-C5)-methyltransferase